MSAEILRKDNYGPCGFRWLTLKRITVSRIHWLCICKVVKGYGAVIAPLIALYAVQYKDQTGRCGLGARAERLAAL